MRLKSAVITAAVLGGLCGLPVQAADGLYLGAGIGQATIKDDTSSVAFD